MPREGKLDEERKGEGRSDEEMLGEGQKLAGEKSGEKAWNQHPGEGR